MESLGERLIIHYLPFTNLPLPGGGLNIVTVVNSILAMAAMWFLLWLGARRFAAIPGRAQALVEALVGEFDALVSSTLDLGDRAKERHYLPLIIALFVFIILANALPLLPLPYIEEPTNDINTTLALALISVVYSLYCNIKHRGVLGFLEELCGPLWHDHDSGAMGKISALFFFPLKVVEELARVVSLSCRLFGNIMGAAMLIGVISYLTYSLFTPLPMYAFFLVFESVLQAFVFSILTLMYIKTSISE